MVQVLANNPLKNLVLEIRLTKRQLDLFARDLFARDLANNLILVRVLCFLGPSVRPHNCLRKL